MRKPIIIISCLLALTVLTAAVKTKKTTVSKTSKQISELKERISGLEAQKVSLTAKVALLEKDVKKFKKNAGLHLTAAATAGGTALLLAVIMIAGAIGKGAGKKEAEEADAAPPDRAKHFEDIEYHVLNDWQNIWFHPENIDMKLFDDLQNHFPEIYSDITAWKSCVEKRSELGEKTGRDLAVRYPQVEATPNIYLLAYEDPDVFVEDSGIKSGPYVCAHIKTGTHGTHEMMDLYYEECRKMFEKKPYSEMKSLNGEIIGLKNDIDLKIRKIKFTRELPGHCGYIKA